MDFFDDFEIDLLDHLEVNGQGIDINYPLSNNINMRKYFFLKADSTQESYDTR